MLKENCYFYTEYQDMGARIPCCTRYTQLGKCPCDNCDHFLDNVDVRKIIKKYLDGELIPNNWIPITERLPEENKTVIASTSYGVYPETRYTKENGWEWAYESGADYWVELATVTAWMPLPKPYKESEEVTNDENINNNL